MLTTRSSTSHGFFSCCNIRLHSLVYFWNEHRTVPYSIDDTNLFKMYKPSGHETHDIADHFFKTCEEVQIDSSGTVRIVEGPSEDQFSPYSWLCYNDTQQFIQRYFSPSQPILDLQASLVAKYEINVSNTCAMYYRGTDKYQETTLGSFDEYAAKMSELIRTNPDLQIILQSDCYSFLEYMFNYADTHNLQNNIMTFEENVTTTSDQGVHFLRRGDRAYQDIRHLFASLLIMSQCKYIICSSSNVSLWMMYYRGHAKNVYQLLNNRWV